MNSDHQQPSGGAVRSSDLVRPKLSSAILTNLALGRGLSDREREAVERSSATQLRESLPNLLGLKRPQAPILHLLECSECGCPEQSRLAAARKIATEWCIRIFAYCRCGLRSNI
jgi:hypothetical protein